MRILTLLAFPIFLFSPLGHANYTCEGQVQGLSIDPKSGAVLAEKIGPLGLSSAQLHILLTMFLLRAAKSFTLACSLHKWLTKNKTLVQ